jgi:hypothetical protein
MRRRLLSALLGLSANGQALQLAAQGGQVNEAWTRPFPAFRIVGNVYS